MAIWQINDACFTRARKNFLLTLLLLPYIFVIGFSGETAEIAKNARLELVDRDGFP